MTFRRNLYINTNKGAIIYNNHMANYTLLSMVRHWGGTERDIFKFEASQGCIIRQCPQNKTVQKPQHSISL